MISGSDAGQAKTKKATELGVRIIDEDGLFELIRTLPAQNISSSAPPAKKHKTSAPPASTSTSTSTSAPIDSDDVTIVDRKTSTPSQQPSQAASQAISGIPSRTATAATKAVAVSAEHQLWADRFAPASVRELVGNQGQVEKLIAWLRNWDELHKKDAPKPVSKPGGFGQHGVGVNGFAVLISGNDML